MSWIMVAAAVVTVVAGAAEAHSQREAGKANQAIAENNARLDEASAQDAANLGARESQQASWRTRALIGKQRASIAAAGVDSQLGTPMDLQTDAALFGGADKSAIQMDAARKAWGFQSSALNYRNQGAQARWQGNTQSNITILRTIGSAMSMGSSAKGAGTTKSPFASSFSQYGGSTYSYGNNGAG